MALARKPIEIIENSKNPLLSIHKSWGRVFIKDIAEILNGYAFKSSLFSNEDGMPLIRIRDVNKNKTETYYQGEYQDTYVVKNGDFLIGMDGDFNSVVWKGGDALLNQRVCKISLTSKDYDFGFLTYALQPYLNAIHAETSAVTVKHLSSKTIGEIPLPLPPLEQQKQIVVKIEELFSHIDAGIEGLKKSKALLKQYRQSVLKAAVTGELTKDWREQNASKIEPASQLLERILKERQQRWEQQQLEQFQAKGKPPTNDKWKDKYQEPKELEIIPNELLADSWKWVTIGQVFEVYVGATPSRKIGSYWNGEVNWVSSGEVSFCKIKKTKEQISELGLANTSTQIHPPGTVMLGMIGEGKTRGQVAILDIFAAHNQNTAAIEKIFDEQSTEYLYFYLMQQYEVTRKRGAGNNQKALNKTRVQEIEFPLAPLLEQNEIVQRVEEKLTAADRLIAELDTKLTQAQQQKRTILASAFSGQLVKNKEQ